MKAVAIGASTGGPDALRVVVSSLPADLPAAVVLVQHLPGYFTKTLVVRLNRYSVLPVVEMTDQTMLEAGKIYVVPGDKHFLVTSPGNVIRLIDATERPHPSIDFAFTSVAEHFGPDTIGVVLTGMGDDGVKGAQAIRQLGGVVVAQDKPSSVIYGMPDAVRIAGHADHIVPLSKIAETIVELVNS